ncbi:MAG: sigma 54-interacting transcriptional regulator, partial [Tissierellia bacterium]|nr:sigma 54-interacting transcriptional regulator [Tissierellia bacterium]
MDIEEEKNLIKFLLDSLEEGVLVIDNKNQFYYGNQAFLSLLDVEKEHIKAENFPHFIKDKEIQKLFFHCKGKKEEEFVYNNNNILMQCIPYREKDKILGYIYILKDITDIKDSKIQLMELKTSLDMIEDILEYAYEGFVLVDKDGRIAKMNYEKLMGLKEKDHLGRPVEDVIENTRMHIVVKTGKKELRHVQRIQGYDMITNRVPIIRDGEVIAAVGTVLFRDASEVKELARELAELEHKINEYRGEIERLQDSRYSFDSIKTQDPKMEYLKKLGRKASESNSTVLILGESGTGKEMFAQAIHRASYRKTEAFVPINCAAIPNELLESELFGYEGGAFTGAKREGKPGKFELANGGTIFLDEIGSMPLEMQAKLLRVLEERKFEKVGGTKKIALDIRVIAATNEDIEEAVKEGRFREDLYYRLNVITLDIPPLREKIDDIPILCEELLDYLSKELDAPRKTIDKQTIDILKKYHWPGNVRELRNVLERGMNFSYGDSILPKHLPERVLSHSDFNKNYYEEIKTLNEVVAQAEKEAIINAINKAGGNKTKAAELLDIHRTALYKK